MFQGIKKIVDGVGDIIEPLNPLVTDMTPKNIEIATMLLEKGYSVSEIQDFVDVSRIQLDDFIKLESQVIERLKKITEKTVEKKK